MAGMLPACPTKVALAGMWMAWFAFAVYVFGLPLLSRAFLDELEYWKLCSTPAEDIVCGDGQPYLNIAQHLGRYRDGKYWGCSCGEGIFGDWACPVLSFNPDPFSDYIVTYYSLGYFLTTASSTGLFAALSFIPMMATWTYGCWTLNFPAARWLEWKKRFAFVTQVAFQFFYGASMFFTVCMFPDQYRVVLPLLFIAAISHFFAVSWLLYDYRKARAVRNLAIFAGIVMKLGWLTTILDPEVVGFYLTWYGLWFAECVGFSTIFLITPLLWTLTNGHGDDCKEHAGYLCCDIDFAGISCCNGNSNAVDVSVNLDLD